MTAINSKLSDCRYCSEISQKQGEDPIGTAGQAETWLIIEVSRPWKPNVWDGNPAFGPLIEILEQWEQLNQDLSLRLMAIAPDREFSQPDSVRVFYYRRPDKMFAKYVKQEYIVNRERLVALVKAILLEPEQLAEFEGDRQNTDNIREILVCTHTQVDVACGRFGTPLYEKLRKNYVPASDGSLRVWQTSHFGGHKFAPTLIDFPSGRFWGHLQPEVLDSLIYYQGDITGLKPFYRGWSGLGKFEQIAEREIWMREGWEWQNYNKSGRIIAKDRGNIFKIMLVFILKLIPAKKVKFLLQKLDKDVDWAEVEITYQSPENYAKQKYKVRVEAKINVMTAAKSAKEMQLKPVKQYYVSKIKKLQK